MIDNSFNAAFSIAAGARLGQAAGLMMGGRIAASFADRLEASAYAFRELASLYQVQAGLLAGGEFAPLPEAKWEAKLTGEHGGDIDLGDGYTLQLDERNSEITIRNAATGETTRIWGDPHVEVDGQHVYDFWGTTTFTLENGTKITIGTEPFGDNPNAYVASSLTITKDDRAILVEGISQNQLGDLSISMSNDGEALDAATRDGFVLNENATGSGWRSELTGEVATQADLDATRPGALYGPDSTMPSLGELGQLFGAFLLFGFAIDLAAATSTPVRTVPADRPPLFA
ncbi:hypothetical protein COC42_01875 [Sphingomonas spermidinifaciens]|uniref:DUF1521 domain-containing protein n=1 Tax=Sphingomonas spermidinifaciens TaxID=1141889 RepID=A0A2A4B5H0_9SPHN|nr:DUF1521 domain-containing protein [Sphingomonas spermidinifaciens]PCD03195.1 hypothetical protein COC42_01875 [Sphingomonas spermidinifaciens]